jgi:hypothetical protein
MDSKIKRQIQAMNSGNGVYAKDCRYTWWDHKTNEEILNELKVTSILGKIISYSSDCIQHINRIPRSILPN